MAEPAHRLDDPEPGSVYDKPGTTTSSPRPDLKALEGGGETSEPKTGHLEPVNGEEPGEAPTRDDLSTAEEAQPAPSQPRYEKQVGRGYRRGQPPASRFSLRGRLTKKRAALATVIIGVVLSIVVLILSLFNFELQQIKHVVTDEIGGVQSRVYKLGRTKMYSTMFFFDKTGNFNGFKATGIRRLMLENRSTKQMVKVLEDNGYKLTFDQSSGKVLSLAKIGPDGNVIESYDSNSSLQRAWSIKDTKALPNILQEVFPDKSDIWYSSATRQLYRRLGLTRTNWLKDFISDKTGVTKLNELELQFREALRQKLFGTGTGASVTPGEVPKEKDPNNPSPEGIVAQEANNLASSASAEQLRQAELNDPNLGNPTNSAIDSINADLLNTTALEDGVASLPKSAEQDLLSGRALNVLGYDQMVCEANSALNDIVKGARILRSYELLKFSLAILTIADAEQNGSAVNGQQVNAIMQFLNSQDKNGRTMFASSGWQFWAGTNSGKYGISKYDKNQVNDYSVGGGFTGTLGLIRSYINDKLKLGVNCAIATNPIVSFGGLAAGLGLSIISGGGFTVTNLAAQAAIQFAFSFALSTATSVLTPMVAGTVVNGLEQGTAIGNAFISGSEVLVGANAANSGMRPLTTSQYKVAESGVQNDQMAELAQMSLKDRIFSTDNTHSLASTALLKLNGLNLHNILGSFISSPASIFGRIGSIFSGNSLAASDNSGCTDPDITNNNLASTPFCDPVMGIPDGVMNNPTYAPDKIDDSINLPQNTNGTPNVDDNGQAVPGSLYYNYLDECTADNPNGSDAIDIIHQDLKGENSSYTSRCTNDLFNMYRFWMTVAQGENDALTGNLSP